MSTVKISQLTELTDLDANTSNSLFVMETRTANATALISATTLSQHLYSNNSLLVGQNPILFPNTVAQLSNTDPLYIQVNIQNFSPNGSSDLILTADNGDNTNSFVDLGINNSQWNPTVAGMTAQYPYDGYLIVDGPSSLPKGNLVIGTANPGTNLVFSVGGLTSSNVPAVMTANGLVFKTSRYLTFADNSQQTTAAAPISYTQAAFDVANTANVSIAYISGVNSYQNTFSQAAFNLANTALQNTSTITANSNLVVPGSLTTNTISAVTITTANTTINNGVVSSANIQGNYLIANTFKTANVTINNDVVIADSGLFQYTTANNSTVTQLTSKSTGVTCHGRTGQITTSNASLAKGAAVEFTVTNNQIVSAKDVVIVNIASGATASSYAISVTAVTPGSFNICIENNGAGALTDTLVINFAILRVN